MSDDVEPTEDEAVEPEAVEAEPEAAPAAAEAEPEPEPEPEILDGAPVTWSHGQAVLHPSREDYLPLVTRLREEGYWTCVDVCGVDYLTYEGDRNLPPGTEPERFEVTAVLRNHATHEMRRIRVQVPESDPDVASLTSIHPGAHNPEREIYDMFGVTFDGHLDLSRILMPDDWDGHPLRKDYAVGRIPVQFKGVSSAR